MVQVTLYKKNTEDLQIVSLASYILKKPNTFFLNALVLDYKKVSNSSSPSLVNPRSQEDPLEKEMATHSNILPWKIPWTEEPGGVQSMRLQRVEHD